LEERLERGIQEMVSEVSKINRKMNVVTLVKYCAISHQFLALSERRFEVATGLFSPRPRGFEFVFIVM
jgi:hypothetical protein